jgi:hypothetical protein
MKKKEMLKKMAKPFVNGKKKIRIDMTGMI